MTSNNSTNTKMNDHKEHHKQQTNTNKTKTKMNDHKEHHKQQTNNEIIIIIKR